jgi:hypothetical protein
MGTSRAPCAPHLGEQIGEHRIRKQLEAVPVQHNKKTNPAPCRSSQKFTVDRSRSAWHGVRPNVTGSSSLSSAD